MKIDFKLDIVDHIRMKKGESYLIESLTHPVLPDFLMVIPDIQLPDFLSLTDKASLDMEGTHGSIYTIKAIERGKGFLISSFQDLKSGKPILEKKVAVEVH